MKQLLLLAISLAAFSPVYADTNAPAQNNQSQPMKAEDDKDQDGDNVVKLLISATVTDEKADKQKQEEMKKEDNKNAMQQQPGIILVDNHAQCPSSCQVGKDKKTTEEEQKNQVPELV